MTHKEDIKRLTIMNQYYQDYLHNRIEVLENRLEVLEEQLEISRKQSRGFRNKIIN